jgi:hypothetical protein
MMNPMNNLNLAGIPIYNAQVPLEGPRAIPLTLDFTSVADATLDGKPLLDSTKISMVQTIYIDTSATDNALSVTVGNSGQVIKVKGRTQGYYPVFAPNPFAFTFHSAGVADSNLVPVYLLNFPVAPAQWATQ